MFDDVDAVAESEGFSGVVTVDVDGVEELRVVRGLADRRWGIPNSVETAFALASGSKGFTALAVLSLVEDGAFALDTPVRDLLGDDLPLIDPLVTVRHLLTHRSGIGDYLDEGDDGAITDYVMGVPVHTLVNAADFLPVVDGFPQVFPPGERFAYCNGGFVVLSIIAERVSGIPFADLVAQRVFEPAGMRNSGYFRSDALPSGAAVGYLFGPGDDDRTNVLHLPVRGAGDGGAYATAADLSRFWRALFAGAIVSKETVVLLSTRTSTGVEGSRAYGTGFWLDDGGRVALEGYDAGVSYYGSHDPATGRTVSVLSNWSDGAWPVARALQSS